MARKSGKKAFSSAASRTKRRQIWHSGDVGKWKAFLTASDPKSRPWEVKSNSVWSHCVFPQHLGDDNTPSMRVHVEKGYVKCYGCETYVTDPVEFVAHLAGKPYGDSVRDIQSYFGVSVLNKTDIKKLEEDFKHVTMKNHLAVLLKAELRDAYSAWLMADKGSLKGTAYEYAEALLRWLENRKVLHNCIHLPIGILPTEVRLKEAAKGQGIDDQELKAMLLYLNKVMDVYNLGALVMIYHATPKNVANFRLRQPIDSAKKTIIAVADDSEETLGIFGLGMYAEIADKKEGIGSTVKALVVEGEFDQMQYASHQIDNANFDWVVLAHGGGANRNLLELKDYGIRNIYYVPDCDTGGDTNAREILSDNRGFNFHVFNWPNGLLIPGGGSVDLDLALKTYGFLPVHEAINDLEHNWLSPGLWCKLKVKDLIRQKNLLDDEGAVLSLVLSYAPCVGDNQDPSEIHIVNKWIQETLAEEGVSLEQAEKYANDYVTKDSADIVFRNQIQEKLEQSFEFIAVDRYKPMLPIKVWHRKNHEILEIRLGSASHVDAILGSKLGSLVEWVRKELGLPDFVRFMESKTGDTIERALAKQEEMILDLIVLALKEISSRLKSVSSYETYAAGCHWLHTKEGFNLFIVNKPNIFRCEFSKDGMSHWSELESPVFENYLFDTTREAWSQEIKKLSDLVDAPCVELKDLIKKTREVLDTGWTFVSQETETYAHASFIVASTVLKIFNQNMQFLASNERSSGKTTLYAELIGGGKGTDINLVEHSKFMDNATAAGIRQTMDGSSLILVLDEFDNVSAGKFRSEKMEDIMTILRCSSSGEGRYVQGTQGGEPKTWRLSFSSMISGIDPDVTNANMTRFYTTDLKSGLDSKLPPRTSILQKYEVKHIQDLKSQISRCVYRFIPKILQSYTWIRNYCTTENPTLLGEDNLQRFKDNMFIIMAVLHAAGLDWEDWARKTREAKRSALRQLSHMTQNEKLFGEMMYAPNIVAPGIDSTPRMVADYMVYATDLTHRNALNASGAGVYLYPDTEGAAKDDTWSWYLVVVWQQAMHGALKNTTLSRTKTDPTALKVIGDRHHLALKDDEVDKVLAALKEVPLILRNTPMTVFDVTCLVRKDVAYRREKKNNGLALIQPEASGTVHVQA